MTATPSPREPERTRLLILALPIAFAAILLYFATRGAHWDEIGAALASCRPGFFFLGWILLTMGTSVRALRWRMLLSSGKPVPYPVVFWATMAGSLGNNYLPARAGEVIRSFCVASAGISGSFALATAFGERLLDALVLSAIGAGAMLALPGLPTVFLRAAQLVAGSAAVGVLLIGVLPHLEERLLNLFPAPDRAGRLACALRKALLQVLEGMRAFHHIPRLCSFVGLSTTAWLLDAAGAMVIARALDFELDFLLALLLLAALGLSSGLPSTPGYVGIFQFVAVSILTPFGFSRSQAMAFIFAYQAGIYAVATLWGGIGLWKMRGLLHGRRLFQSLVRFRPPASQTT